MTTANNNIIAPERPLVIAGPCSAETEEQVMATARAVAAAGVKIFRAGVWKPRTKPGGFEGVGAVGLEWLARVKRETGMQTATEIATREHVEAALAAGVDILWIGARTTANPFAVQEIADSLEGKDVPVMVKNPVSPDIELWIGAFERLRNAGVRRMAAIHRGFATIEQTIYRNEPMWSLPIELRRRMPSLQIICDPSHIAGRRQLVPTVAQQAMDLGFDGVMIESHCTPDTAWSDSAQQLDPKELATLLNGLAVRSEAAATESLAELRSRIDAVDDRLVELLTERMRISREIGRYKRAHNLPVLQSQRYEELLARRCAEAARAGMSPAFMHTLLQAIHEESVNQQLLD